MPRVAKPKVGGSSLPVAAELVPEGEIITDLSKKSWKVGKTIGKGGFGYIYAVTEVSGPSSKTSDNNYVAKIESHENGTLFVEMHFYMRNARLKTIEDFMKTRGLKSLGMPHFVGNGSHTMNDKKLRFLVIPRYDKNIEVFLNLNDNKLPLHTTYRLALQMLDVYEYIHDKGYIHGDLKAQNILIGNGKNGASQAYLVDFGMACQFTKKQFKPDPKKQHNGTLHYLSRDAHLGVPTMRGDMEVLGYNIIEWSGAALPWIKCNLPKVQKLKEALMSDVAKGLQSLYPNTVPQPILEFMLYVQALEYNEPPDYQRCRNMFHNGLNSLKKQNSGILELIIKNPTAPAKTKTPTKRKTPTKTKTPTKSKPVVASDDEEIIDDSDDAFDDSTPNKKRKITPLRIRQATKAPVKRGAKLTPKKVTPLKPLKQTPKEAAKDTSSDDAIESPTVASRESPRKPTRETPKRTPKLSPKQLPTKKTPMSANINLHPAVSIKQIGSSHTGKTIINDHLTPNPKSGKTYEFNFELDVSMDANVVVNVRRKKRAGGSPMPNGSTDSKVKVRRIDSGSQSPSSSTLKSRSRNPK